MRRESPNGVAVGMCILVFFIWFYMVLCMFVYVCFIHFYTNKAIE